MRQVSQCACPEKPIQITTDIPEADAVEMKTHIQKACLILRHPRNHGSSQKGLRQSQVLEGNSIYQMLCKLQAHNSSILGLVRWFRLNTFATKLDGLSLITRTHGEGATQLPKCSSLTYTHAVCCTYHTHTYKLKNNSISTLTYVIFDIYDDTVSL